MGEHGRLAGTAVTLDDQPRGGAVRGQEFLEDLYNGLHFGLAADKHVAAG